mmetsp:Transcript_16570/g.35917  ORF Transcript_16570/g.35917 Transcript_16570/m.35917 type:complete len:243 (+) Transcript_16570:386-1114(+)
MQHALGNPHGHHIRLGSRQQRGGGLQQDHALFRETYGHLLQAPELQRGRGVFLLVGRLRLLLGPLAEEGVQESLAQVEPDLLGSGHAQVGGVCLGVEARLRLQRDLERARARARREPGGYSHLLAHEALVQAVVWAGLCARRLGPSARAGAMHHIPQAHISVEVLGQHLHLRRQHRVPTHRSRALDSRDGCAEHRLRARLHIGRVGDVLVPIGTPARQLPARERRFARRDPEPVIGRLQVEA